MRSFVLSSRRPRGVGRAGGDPPGLALPRWAVAPRRKKPRQAREPRHSSDRKVATPPAMATRESVLETIGEAKKKLPAFLQTSDSATLSKLLPIVNKPWPAACEKALTPALSTSSSMRSPYLPLLQQDQLVTCQICKRVLVIDCFEEHKVIHAQPHLS